MITNSRPNGDEANQTCLSSCEYKCIQIKAPKMIFYELKLVFKLTVIRANAEFIYFSNFNKHHYKEFHCVQCSGHSHLTLDNCRCITLNSTKFPEIIKNAVGSNLYANHLLDSAMDGHQLADAILFIIIHLFIISFIGTCAFCSNGEYIVSRTYHISYKRVSDAY